MVLRRSIGVKMKMLSIAILKYNNRVLHGVANDTPQIGSGGKNSKASNWPERYGRPATLGKGPTNIPLVG